MCAGDVMADDMEAIEAERLHQPDLIAGHGAERIIRPVRRAPRLGRVAVAAQIGADHPEIAGKHRRNPRPHRATSVLASRFPILSASSIPSSTRLTSRSLKRTSRRTPG